MTPLTVFVLLFVCYCDSLSIATVRAKKVTKDADKDATGNFYPDWVPFKNKHGDELGEFKPVPKAKPKKRLALPVNFVMRAVAEPGDDYFDKGQGDSDNEDYYEKKDWSDLNRNAKQVDPDKVVNITSVDTSDIEGIVNIITKPETNPIIDLIQGKNETENVSPPEIEVKEKEPEIQEEKQKVEEEKEQTEDSDKIKTNENVKEEKQENESVEEDDEDDSKSHKSKEESKPKENNDSEEETDEEDEEPHKQKSQQEEQEQKENEEKKAKILSSVDELKERHAEEQRAINERVKEEEEHEREKGRNSKEFQDIYNERPSKWKKSSEYDEYDEDISSVEDKYKIISEKSTTTTQKPTTKKKSKGITGKLSVFKNPQLYVAYEDDSDEVTTSEPKTPKSEKFSSRYSATEPEDEENVRISLVPEDNDSKDGEPTLFYPKKKKKNKTKSTTEPTDSFVAESAAEDQKTHSTLVGTIATVIAPSGVDITSSASNTAPSGPDAAPSASDAKSATDSQHASTDKKEEKKNEDFDFERGGGRQHHSEHEEEHEEHGKKAYEIPTRRPYWKCQGLKPEGQLPWASTRSPGRRKATTRRKTTSASMLTTAASTSNTTTRVATTAPTTMRNMARNTPSTKNQASIRRATVRRAVTTSTRRKNMRKEWNSLKKKATPLRKNITVDTMTRKNINRAVTSRRANWIRNTKATTKVTPVTTRREQTTTRSRATRSPMATTATDGTTTHIITKKRRKVVASGSTTTATQRRQPT
ncbi:uncharacterized protein [Epargyreus clarus]|uniref:uncharacterized protein isoform X2 n=1 Tax=Epargyreus clarus TaxID=520877 RepID=UPI003C2E8DA5